MNRNCRGMPSTDKEIPPYQCSACFYGSILLKLVQFRGLNFVRIYLLLFVEKTVKNWYTKTSKQF